MGVQSHAFRIELAASEAMVKNDLLVSLLSQLVNKGGGGGGWKKKGGGGGGWKKKDIASRTGWSKKIYIGNLPAIEDRDQRKEASKKLYEMLQKKSECKFAEIWKNGTGVAIFKTDEDAQAAVSSLAGTKFRGKALEIDSWEKKS